MKRHHEPPVLLYCSGILGWLAWFSLQMFCQNNKIHFSLANANNSASIKRKMVLNDRFCSFTTTNKLVNEAANDSARVRVSGQDRKKTAPSRNQSDCRFSRILLARKLRKNKFKLCKALVWSTREESHEWLDFSEKTFLKPLSKVIFAKSRRRLKPVLALLDSCERGQTELLQVQ